MQASQTVKSDAGSEHEAQAPINLEGQQYVDSKSYITFEICLTRPLIPKRPPEELARRVAEYIPPRPLFPKRTDGAQRVSFSWIQMFSIFYILQNLWLIFISTVKFRWWDYPWNKQKRCLNSKSQIRLN